MSKKKQKKKRNPTPAGAKKPVRLSQCMIVKNEERNIEKALSWAKDIAFEQIVVDTGSTDRTVEIAESMGAKVFHFEWINDFAAAKNYAIEQASGRWIAFLDADEYFSDEDAKKLEEILERLTNNIGDAKKYESVICPCIQVDDNSVPFAIFHQRRIFRNLPDIRYVGRIHETLSTSEESTLNVTEIGIVHTGYSKTAYKDTNKAQRNIDLLEKELADCPDNVNLKCYLADALKAEGSQENINRAVALYLEVIENEERLYNSLKHGVFTHLISYFSNRDEHEKSIELCRKAILAYPDAPDFYAHLGSIHYNKQEYSQAWEMLRKCEETLVSGNDLISRSSILTNPIILFAHLAVIAQKLGDVKNTVHYSVLTLKEDKYQKGVLAPLIQVLSRDENTSDADIFGLLGRLYDLSNNKDRAFILLAAKKAGNREVFDMTRDLFTEDEIEHLKIPTFEGVDGEQNE